MGRKLLNVRLLCVCGWGFFTHRQERNRLMSIKLCNTAFIRVYCECDMDPFGIICEKVRVVFDTWTFFIMDTGKTLLTFLAGAAVGAMTALLLAPDSGDKTRGRLRAKAAGVADMAKGKILEGLDAIEAALQEE